MAYIICIYASCCYYDLDLYSTSYSLGSCIVGMVWPTFIINHFISFIISMKKITYRELIVNLKTMFPLPDEGTEIVTKFGNFFIYGRPMNVVDVDALSDLLVSKLRGVAPSGPTQPASPLQNFTPLEPVVEKKHTCDWQLVLPTQEKCGREDTQKVKLTVAGKDAREVYLCDLHLQVAQRINQFVVEML